MLGSDFFSSFFFFLANYPKRGKCSRRSFLSNDFERKVSVLERMDEIWSVGRKMKNLG